MTRYIYIVFLFVFFGFSPIISADELINLNSEQLISMQKNNALVIDIRTPEEWKDTGTILESHKIEFFNSQGNYDTAAWLKQLNKQIQTPDQSIILVCRSGNRSKKIGDLLTRQMGMKNIYHLENGMNAWLKAGNKTQQDCTPLIACNKQ